MLVHVGRLAPRRDLCSLRKRWRRTLPENPPPPQPRGRDGTTRPTFDLQPGQRDGTGATPLPAGRALLTIMSARPALPRPPRLGRDPLAPTGRRMFRACFAVDPRASPGRFDPTSHERARCTRHSVRASTRAQFRIEEGPGCAARFAPNRAGICDGARVRAFDDGEDRRGYRYDARHDETRRRSPHRRSHARCSDGVA